jgi:triacylglycerol esterase/lipase EstA (alpha/beta hydrolase family)
MLNTLKGDPNIHDKYQFWFFMYPTGNPVLYSAANLRDSLKELYRAFSDDAEENTLDRMVLVGHSMGGLLSKLMVKPSSNLFWRSEVNIPYTSLSFSDKTRNFIERVFFFEPLPFVERVIFIATPHRGSAIASGTVGWFGSSLIKLPEEYKEKVQKAVSEIVDEDDSLESDVLKDMKLDTGIDNLSPKHPFNTIANSTPFPTNIIYHSIIGNNRAADTPGGTDGVVPYTSSHLDGAETEIIVKSGHNAHTHPGAIKEVKRILLEQYNQTE